MGNAPEGMADAIVKDVMEASTNLVNNMLDLIYKQCEDMCVTFQGTKLIPLDALEFIINTAKTTMTDGLNG